MPRVTISVPDKTPQPYRFELEREFINIGRGGDNDIIIDNASISTQHCMIERVEGGYILRDNGSTNGLNHLLSHQISSQLWILLKRAV